VLQRENGTCEPGTFPAPKCWGLPPDCSTSGSKRYQSCVQTTPERTCLNLCQAIDTQLPHIPVRDCRDRPPGP
jgi:hypothetical protein